MAELTQTVLLLFEFRVWVGVPRVSQKAEGRLLEGLMGEILARLPESGVELEVTEFFGVAKGRFFEDLLREGLAFPRGSVG